MSVNIDLIIFLGLVLLGYVFGSMNEKRHFKSIIKREKQLSRIHTFSSKYLPENQTIETAELVSGSVVVSIDYFKSVVAGLRGLVGGRMNAYETLVERARREAILRMKEEAKQKGSTAIFNVKLETASISKGNQNQVGSVEVLAYGTAIR